MIDDCRLTIAVPGRKIEYTQINTCLSFDINNPSFVVPGLRRQSNKLYD